MPRKMTARIIVDQKDWDSVLWRKVSPLPLSPEVEAAVADEISKIAPIWEDPEPLIPLRRCACGRRTPYRYCSACFKTNQQTSAPVTDPNQVREILDRLRQEFADKKKARTVYINGGHGDQRRAAIKNPAPVRGP